MILTRGRKDNTYKFALAKFLLNYAKDLSDENMKEIQQSKEVIIDYKTLAEKFLEYFWYQECKYKIKQNHIPSKPPIIITIIKQIFGEQYIPESFVEYKEKNPEKISKAEAEILKNVFGDRKQKKSQVVPRFQNITNGNTITAKNIFYDYDDKSIRIKSDAIIFFRNNYNLLFKATVLEWAKFLEKMNTIPRLISKIEHDERRRHALTKYTKIFNQFKECFYCTDPLIGTIHVDHFIPWSYIFEDKAWNLVLSCKKCNLKKLDSLAPEEYLVKLLDRNKEHPGIEELGKSLRDLDAGKGWEIEIRRHYRNCEEYGFKTKTSLSF